MDYISRALIADALAEWRALLRARATVSPLRDLVAAPTGTIDLRNAAKAGLAPLFAGRATLLSSLFPERADYLSASMRGSRIIESAEAVMAATGSWTAAIAVGTVVVEGREAPLLLRPVSLERSREDDLTITLRHTVSLNPVFAAELRDRGVREDLASIAQASLEGSQFDPRPLWAKVRSLHGAFGNLEVKERLLLGAFDDPEQRLIDDLDNLDAALASSPVIAAMAGDADAAAAISAPPTPRSTMDRDPFGERGMGALDDAAFAVLDLIAGGRSLVVETPPGSEPWPVVAAMVADAAATGRTAAVVGGDRDALAQVEQTLRGAGADDLLLSALGDAWNSEARVRLLASLTLDAPAVDEASLRALGEELIDAQAACAAGLDALHRPVRPWGVSPFEAIQAIVRLTTSTPTPNLHLRLGEEAVAAMAEHGIAHVISAVVARTHGTEVEVASLAAEAIAARAAEEASRPWWYRVASSPEEGAALDAALAEVVRALPGLRSDAALAHASAGVDEATTPGAWRSQVRLFGDVQRTLDTFAPAVYHRSLTELVAATAPKGTELDVRLSRSERRDLSKRASELLRPGRDASQLHASLQAAADESARWREIASGGGWPTVPDGFDAFRMRVERFDDAWLTLAAALRVVSGFDDPDAATWAELAQALQLLVEGLPGGLEAAPAAPAVIDLEASGFGEVLAAAAATGAAAEQVRADVEFAWWATAFDAMAATQPGLVVPGALGAAMERFRAADEAFGARRIEPLMRAVGNLRRRAIQRSPEDARDLFATLMEGVEVSVRGLMHDFMALAGALRPVVIAPADHVVQVLPPTQCVDLLVVVGADALTTAELIPAIARARQVVVVADPIRATRSAVRDLVAVLPPVRLPALPCTPDVRVQAALGELGYGASIPIVAGPGSALRAEGLEVVLVDALGAAGLEGATVQTTRAEVAAVVERVMRESARGNACLVVAGNDLHASAVARALAERDPAVAMRVRVVAAGSVGQLRAETVVLSLGFARDSRGILPDGAGALSSLNGRAALAQALGAASRSLVVMSAVTSGQWNLVAEAIERRIAALGDDDSGEQTVMRPDLVELDPRDPRALRILARLMDAATVDPIPLERQTPGPHEWLLADVARLVRGQGLGARLRWGIGGMAAPLVAGTSAGFTVAALTDVPVEVPRESTRDRLRWQWRSLEALGWSLAPLWTVDAFLDPAGCAQRLAAVVRGEPAPLVDAWPQALPQPQPQQQPQAFPGVAPVPQEPLQTDVHAQDEVTAVPVEQQQAAESLDQASPAGEPEVIPTPEEPWPVPADAASDASAPTAVTPEEPWPVPATAATEDEPGADPDAWTPKRVPMRGAGRPLIPTRAWEDEEAAWGDRSRNRDDEIRADRPPHW